MSWLTQRTATLAPPARATVWGLGLNAVVVLVSAPIPMTMSFEVGVGGGALFEEEPVVLLLHPATMATRTGRNSSRKARMGAPREGWRCERPAVAGTGRRC